MKTLAKEEAKKRDEPVAIELAKKQREISVAEFFERNRHLLGFDNKRKALLTVVKEAVDNSLDACEEARILPEISIQIVEMSEEKFRIIVEDNGPGIVKKQIPPIFAQLLYGSKFHTMKQSLTADEPVIIHKDGKISILQIGQFVDSIVGQEELKDVSNLNILVPAFDKERRTYSWRKVSNVIRHKRQNEIIKIKTLTGRTIKVTGCHSLFGYDKNTKRIIELEARSLKQGDCIIAPKILPPPEEVSEINILDYITLEDIKPLWMYVYGLNADFIRNLFLKAEIIHKTVDKSRKFYRFHKPDGAFIDVLDDSFKQYARKGFLPLSLVLELGLREQVRTGVIQTYHHGTPMKIPVCWQITHSLMRFLGLFVAEGHTDIRQAAFTFGLHEDHFVEEVSRTARMFGSNVTIEKRKTSYRVKIFGGILQLLLKNLCGRGAHNKRIPEFAFRVPMDLRQAFLDALYQGDGCLVRKRNCLTLGTVSRQLANDSLYLWLMQGVLATVRECKTQGFGSHPSTLYVVTVYGKDIAVSDIFKPQHTLRWKHSYKTIDSGAGNALLTIQQQHMCLLKIKEIEVINEGYEYVYDLSVPECENFVGGFGGLACHNSRGQQGIGISAAVLYAQLTTGRAARITSRISPKEPSHYYELHIDTSSNEPQIVKETEVEWKKEQGTKIELDIEASYQKGDQSVDSYLKQTAIVNPHATILYTNPKAEQLVFPRATDKLPKQPTEIKPHPYGVEIGILIKMLRDTESRTLQSFLTNEFSRVGPGTAKEICEHASLMPNTKPVNLTLPEIEKLMEGIKKTKIIAPTTDCIVPIGEQLLEKGLRKEVAAEFYTAVTRTPDVYKGIPFVVEAALAFGGEQPGDETIRILRFANRVPLLYQQSACAIFKSIVTTNWKPYGLQQSGESMPSGPLTIAVHIASVWPPFTSEAKEAIAHYPEIIKEIKLCLQECGRRLGAYVNKRRKVALEQERVNIFERYIPEVAHSLAKLTGEKADKIEALMKKMLSKNKEFIIKNKVVVSATDKDDNIKIKGSFDDEYQTKLK